MFSRDVPEFTAIESLYDEEWANVTESDPEWRAMLALRKICSLIGGNHVNLNEKSNEAILILPLRFNLARGRSVGVPTDIGPDWCQRAITAVNNYWMQAAGIVFELKGCEDVDYESSEHLASQVEARRADIWSMTREGDRQQQKQLRRQIFLNDLIPHHASTVDAYDLHLFDFIGQTFQVFFRSP